MSEATEFLVFCSALRETPGRLKEFGKGRADERVQAILGEMADAETLAVAELEAILAGGGELPAERVGSSVSRSEDPLRQFLDRRRRLLELLDGVDGATLHRTGRLPSGRPLDPWRLAGNLADHDVRCMARLRGYTAANGGSGGGIAGDDGREPADPTRKTPAPMRGRRS